MYLDETFEEPRLRFNGRELIAMEQTSKIFPAMAKLLKAKEFNYYSERDLLTQLIHFNNFLKVRIFFSLRSSEPRKRTPPQFRTFLGETPR